MVVGWSDFAMGAHIKRTGREPDGIAEGLTAMHRSKGKHFQCNSATVLCATVNSKARERLEESVRITILSAPPLTCINDVNRMKGRVACRSGGSILTFAPRRCGYLCER